MFTGYGSPAGFTGWGARMTVWGGARGFAWCASVAALAWSAPAVCGEEILYQPAPEWVLAADLPNGRSGPTILLRDDQRRIEGGRIWSYIDTAVRVDSPQMLTAIGTLQAAWLPDKGDLIIHRVAILRGGQEINVIGGGARFDVLRRERQLEQRMLDGSYTATMPVPGLRVGDVLRLSYSVTLSDQALDQEVQAFAPLPTKPVEMGLGRVRISWPEGAEVRWQAGTGVAPTEVAAANGYKAIELALPLPEPGQMPEDAPVRYRMLPMLQVGTFADWQEVSRTMAPLFTTERAITADGPIAGEVAKIMNGHQGDLARTITALRLVQDEIAYLANGMGGGNYIPQAPAETWELRYGDCKAKTVLLLAMLREMGIEAEAVLVSSQMGDALPQLLPMPAAFDHVIVRATINGTSYWLDGTSSGASLSNAGRVPAFANGLPLRMQGADLEPLSQRAPEDFDVETMLWIDHRAGLDLPALFDAKWTISGAAVGATRALISQATEEQRFDFVDGFVSDSLGNHWLIGQSMDYDEDRNLVTINASGTLPSTWTWERGTATRQLELPTTGFEFKPDRSRSAWREIPVSLAGPLALRTELTLLLPQDSKDFRMEGAGTVDENVAGIRLLRRTDASGDRLLVTDSAIWPGGELPAARAAETRAQAARLGKLNFALRAPADAERRHRFAQGGDRSILAPLEQAFADLIAAEPDDASRYSDRARFRAWTYDLAGALSDLDAAIELEPDADLYQRRAGLHFESGDLDAALADARSAGELAPGLAAASLEAHFLAHAGQYEEAIALLEDQAEDSEQRKAIAIQISDFEAQAGRKAEGLARIASLLEQRPGDPQLLNQECYYRASWNYELDGVGELCTSAVERSDWSPPVLDSRALAYYRLGQYEQALKDLDAALAGDPEQVPSLFLRGVVRLRMGDREGSADIREARARMPSITSFYERFGIIAD